MCVCAVESVYALFTQVLARSEGVLHIVIVEGVETIDYWQNADERRSCGSREPEIWSSKLLRHRAAGQHWMIPYGVQPAWICGNIPSFELI